MDESSILVLAKEDAMELLDMYKNNSQKKPKLGYIKLFILLITFIISLLVCLSLLLVLSPLILIETLIRAVLNKKETDNEIYIRDNKK